MERQLKSFVHETTCRCEICKIPQLKFIMFQIGCHYSRLLWMINKRDISMKFNDFAFEHWQNVSDKLRRSKDCEFLMINKLDFAVFSIRWLFQCADTLVSLSNYEEIEEIYKEIELIITDSIPDHECFKQALHCRKENLDFLLEHGPNGFNKPEPQLTYEKFILSRCDKSKLVKFKKSSKSPVTIKRTFTAPTILPKKNDVIYIDSGDEGGPKVIKKVKKANSVTSVKAGGSGKQVKAGGKSEASGAGKSGASVVTVKRQVPALVKAQGSSSKLATASSSSTATAKPQKSEKSSSKAQPSSSTIDLTDDTPSALRSSSRPTRRRMI